MVQHVHLTITDFPLFLVQIYYTQSLQNQKSLKLRNSITIFLIHRLWLEQYVAHFPNSNV